MQGPTGPMGPKGSQGGTGEKVCSYVLLSTLTLCHYDYWSLYVIMSYDTLLYTFQSLVRIHFHQGMKGSPVGKL